MIRTSLLLMIFLQVAAVTMVASAGKAAAGETAVSSVVARVNGVDLTAAQLDEIVNELIPRAFFHGNITRDKRDEYRPKAMEELIRRELYYQEAKKTGITVSADDIDKSVKELEERYKAKGGLEKAMKAGGVTMDALRNGIERSQTIKRFEDREIHEKAGISEEFLRGYYDQHKSEFLRPEAVRIRMISIHVDPAATKEERENRKGHAQEVLAKAKKGEDFADLAFRFSNDAWRVKGGDFGIRHRGQLDPAVEEAAFAMKAGDISDLVKTIYGYHVVKLEERLPQTQLAYDEMKDKLRKTLEDRRKKELEDAVLGRLKEKGKVEILSAPPKPAEGGQTQR